MPSNIELKAQEILEKEEKSFGHTSIPINRLIKKLILISDETEDLLRSEILKSEIISKRKNDQSGVICSTLKASILERQIADQLARLIKTFSSTVICQFIRWIYLNGFIQIKLGSCSFTTLHFKFTQGTIIISFRIIIVKFYCEIRHKLTYFSLYI